MQEEARDGKPEKLSAEYYVYDKEEVTRDSRRRAGKPSERMERNKEAEASAAELAALED